MKTLTQTLLESFNVNEEKYDKSIVVKDESKIDEICELLDDNDIPFKLDRNKIMINSYEAGSSEEKQIEKLAKSKFTNE